MLACFETPMAIDDDAESCGSRAVDSLACENPRQDSQKLEAYNEVLKHIKESNYKEAKMPGFDEQLWHHYNRLPERYALYLNVDLTKVILTHKKLLHLAEDPVNRPAFDVRIVQVYPVSTAHSIESVHSDSSVKDVQSAYHSYRQGIHPPPTFGSSSILETLALQASRYNGEDRDSAANLTSNLCKSHLLPLSRPMHEITFTTIDHPQLQSELWSLLAKVGLNILESYAFSTVDGYSLVVFVVDGWPYETTKVLKNALEKEVLNFKVVENENLRREIERLRTENGYLNRVIAAYNNRKRGFRDEIRKSEEEDDNELLINENKVLKDENKMLAIKGGIPELILQGEESHNCQSTSLGDHPIANNQEMKDLPMPSNIRIPKDEPAFKDIVSTDEPIESFQSTTNHVQMVLTEFLEKLEADVNSNVKLSDFSGLEGERKEVGKYSFPLSLIPIVEKINEVYGDISAGVTMNHMVSETVYVLFCATIKEMNDLQIGEVTEDKMLKWRDVINDALRLNFNVRYAMERLKKITKAYFGQKPVLELQSITAKILTSENELKYYKRRKYAS